MNKISISICTFILALSVNTFSQSEEGIKFKRISFGRALTLAQQEKKLVFIDCYTTWCGPCKKLANEVFTQKEVGEYFNQSFICIKIDMDKEGHEIKSRYEITGYPTLLFVDGNEAIVHRKVGFYPQKELLEIARQANDPERNMITLSEKYKQGIINFDIIKNEFENCKNLNSKRDELFDKYFKNIDLSHWTDSNSWELLSKYVVVTSKYFRFLLTNEDEFSKLYGKDNVKYVLYSIFEHYYMKEETVEEKLKAIAYLKTFNSPIATNTILKVEEFRNMQSVMNNPADKYAWYNFLSVSEKLNHYSDKEGYIYIRVLSKELCASNSSLSKVKKAIMETNHNLSGTMCEFLKLYEAKAIISNKKLSRKDLKLFKDQISDIMTINLVRNYDYNNLAWDLLEHPQRDSLLKTARVLSYSTLSEKQCNHFGTYSAICAQMGDFDEAIRNAEVALELSKIDQPSRVPYYLKSIENFKNKEPLF